MANTKNPIDENIRDLTDYDPWQDMREVELPPAPRGENQSVLVGINGEYWQVPRGKRYTVPFPVYERVMIMRKAERDEYDYLSHIDDTNVNLSNGERTKL